MASSSRAQTGNAEGQALAELALVLPLLILLTVAGVDLARVYQSWITLQSATRNGAVYAATYATDSATALAEAQSVVCAETIGLPGYVAGTAGGPCGSPSVVIASFSRSYTAAGSYTGVPVATVTVTTGLPFTTLVPYPGLADHLNLSVSATFQVAQAP